MKNQKIILHACAKTDWQKAQKEQEYKTSSLDTQGFIHCSEADTIIGVANSHWKDRSDLVLLIIDSAKVKSEIKYELDPKGGKIYPHIYGPLNLDAVTEVKDFLPNSSGIFNKSSIDFFDL